MDEAILKIEKEGAPLNISAVAREVGVTPALIHTTYPLIAKKIREKTGITPEKLLDAKVVELKEVMSALKAARDERNEALSDLQRIASVNETLRREVATLKAAVSGKVLLLTPPADSEKLRKPC